jgi:hypothetical protein
MSLTIAPSSFASGSDGTLAVALAKPLATNCRATMGVLDYFYGPAQSAEVARGEEKQENPEVKGALIKGNENETSHADIPTAKPMDNVSIAVTTNTKVPPSASTPKASSDTNNNSDGPNLASAQSRRFSFRTLVFVSSPVKHKRALSIDEDHAKKAQAASSLSKHLTKPARMASSDRRARQSALILRSIIVGPLSISPTNSRTTKAVSKPQLSKIKAQLMQPKSANKVIAQLRALPVADVAVAGKEQQGKCLTSQAGPIHAVCLEWTEEEANRKHFNRHLMAGGDGDGEVVNNELVAGSLETPSVATASIATLADMFQDMQIVNLISTPDLGLGQPGDGKGILAGALPTAETVINGVQQITPQLMALGYATSRAVFPDHAGMSICSRKCAQVDISSRCLPTNRSHVCVDLSVNFLPQLGAGSSSLIDWWGLELVLPPPTIEYLSVCRGLLP